MVSIMNKLPILSEERFEKDFPDIHQQVCNELGMGYVPAIFRCIAIINPELALSSWKMVRSTLCSGSLPRITKELVFSYIAHKKSCEYCKIAHHALAIHHGFTEESIKTVFNNVEQIKNPALRLVIMFADSSVDNDFSLVPTLDEKLNDLGFSRDEITELICMISCALYMVNLASSLGIDVDQQFTDIIKHAS